MRVFVCEFSQETNSFCPVISTREDFGEWDGGGTKKARLKAAPPERR